MAYYPIQAEKTLQRYEALAAEHGLGYLTRSEDWADRPRHAKAGNLNHALGVIEADVVAVLDADHVARPDLLVNTLGYFDDQRVALVQTPQDFYNLESFEHSRTAARDGFNEQSLFYRAILAGKNGGIGIALVEIYNLR